MVWNYPNTSYYTLHAIEIETIAFKKSLTMLSNIFLVLIIYFWCVFYEIYLSQIFVLGLSREIAGLTGRSGSGGAPDSENETTEVTPDTDTDSQEQLQKHQQQQLQQNQSSFKRPAPIMGHRGLETRNSKRSQQQSQQQQQQQLKKDHSPATLPMIGGVSGSGGSITPNSQPAITVGALEVQNVKRAINRYGTLPKGARIGAYLESLRQNTAGAEINSHQQQPQITASTAPPVPPPMLAPIALTAASAGGNNALRNVVKNQPQMIRSNSSGGVTMTNSATASLNKLQRHRTTTDGSMITFSSFRGTSGSPKRAINPSLADLEFPPPPQDLPPPDEEFELNQDIELPPPRLVDQTPAALLMSQSTMIALAPSNDVSNTEPSVEEASSRFGVSLRKREPSTDSCSSLGSPAGIENSTEAAKEKLELKLVTEIKDRNEYSAPPSAVLPNRHHSRVQTGGDASKDIHINKAVDPASQLVNELAETMNLPSYEPGKKVAGHHLSTLKPNSESTVLAPPLPPTFNSAPNTNTFKAQLKKVEPKKILSTPPKEETNSIIDFKSRLRKVENNNENDASAANDGDHKKSDADHENSKLSSDSGIGDEDRPRRSDFIKKNGDVGGKTSSTSSYFKKTELRSDSTAPTEHPPSAPPPKCNTTAANDDEDKRKSTGSISSLKKLWEAKEGTNNDQLMLQQQLSPKMGIKNAANNNKTAMQLDEENEDHQLLNKKPAVPIKPTKLVSIYATPIQVKLPPSMTTTSATADQTVTTSTATAGQINRDGILELVSLLEGGLKAPVNAISAAQWLQLSEKLNHLQTSCVAFADKETMPPHSKFQFREVVTRVEGQSRCLRTAGSKNIQDNEKLVLEVGQSLKQISNALHR